MSDYLLEQILELTGDRKSTAFFKKVIKNLPEGVVAGLIGDLKHQIHKGAVRNPAKYLTAMCKKEMSLGKAEVTRENVLKTSGFSPLPKLNSHRCNNQTELFAELKPRLKKEGEPGTPAKMTTCYSFKHVPWISFLGPEFFTLSTNRVKSDKVLARFSTFGGDDRLVPVLRGKFFPGDSDRGILTAEHARILLALEDMWLEQSMAHGYDFVVYDETGACHCYCVVSIRELAKRMGWKSFSGQILTHLKRKVMDLSVFGYYLDLDSVEGLNFKGYGFSLLSEVVIMPDKKEGVKGEATLKVSFSDPISRQLINRRAVSRPKEMMRHRGELALLLRMEFERALMGSEYYERTLKELILILHLPATAWHEYASLRKRQFDKAVKELNMCHLVDGRKWQVTLVKTDDDHKLVAQVENVRRLKQENRPLAVESK